MLIMILGCTGSAPDPSVAIRSEPLSDPAAYNGALDRFSTPAPADTVIGDLFDGPEPGLPKAIAALGPETTEAEAVAILKAADPSGRSHTQETVDGATVYSALHVIDPPVRFYTVHQAGRLTSVQAAFGFAPGLRALSAKWGPPERDTSQAELEVHTWAGKTWKARLIAMPDPVMKVPKELRNRGLLELRRVDDDDGSANR